MKVRIPDVSRTVCLIAAFLFLVCAAFSCTKDSVSRFKGNWSYKTSGTLVIREVSSSETPPPDSVSVSIRTESGQMDVMGKDGSCREVIVTLNALLGDVRVFDASVSEGKLEIVPFEESVVILMDDLAPVRRNLRVSGYGERFGDSLVFTLVYEGGFSYMGKEYSVENSSVTCVARLNDK